MMNKTRTLLALALCGALCGVTCAQSVQTQNAPRDEITERDIPAVGERGETQNIARDVDGAIKKANRRVRSNPVANKRLKINNSTHVQMTPGENELIPIARNLSNRIVTPFRNPEIVSATLTGGNAKDGNCGEICIKGNVVYVTTAKSQPASMFITDQGSEEQALSLTLIPREVPPREVFLELSPGFRSGGSKAGATAANDAIRDENYEAESFERSMPYVETIRTMMRQVAQGKIPSGYSLGSVRGARNIPVCKQKNIRFDFMNGQRLTGHNLDIYVGTAKNIGKETLMVNEMACGNWGATAVATWPLHVLNPGQATEVYVIMKEARKIMEAPERPFLIRPEYNNRAVK